MRTIDFSKPAALNELRRIRLSVRLLLERREALYLVLDLLVLLIVLVSTFAAARPSQLYVAAVIPLLLPGILVLSDAVALERRAGSLDLALSSPGAHRYFEKRVGSFAAILALQSCLILLLQRLVASPFPLLPALLQVCVSCALIGAICLCWSVTSKNADAAALASWASVAVLGRWFFASPIPNEPATGFWLGLEGTLDWIRVNAALALAAFVFYAYARRRIAVPERILG